LQRLYIDIDSDDVRAAGAVTAVVDGGLKMITNIKVVAVGEGSSRTIFEVNGTDLYHMNLFDYGAPISPIQLSLAASQAQLHMNWCVDFRCNKLDPDDYSVALPTYLLSSLQLEITYAAPSTTNYGSNPLLTVLTKTLTADTSTGTLEPFDTYFQVGALIRRSFLRVEDSSNVRSDAEMTNYEVSSGTIPLMSNIYTDSQKANNIVNYRLSSGMPRGTQAFASTTSTAVTVPYDNGNYISDGYYMIDFYNNRMPFINTASGLRIGGLSTVGYNTGDLVFKGNFIAASSVIRRVQETVEG